MCVVHHKEIIFTFKVYMTKIKVCNHKDHYIYFDSSSSGGWISCLYTVRYLYFAIHSVEDEHLSPYVDYHI